MNIIKEPYFDLAPKWLSWPYNPTGKYYERIVKKMKHRKRKGK